MKIHAIQTGTVAITTAWREGVGHGRRRLVHTILDRSWTEPLPIYAFAIEHPEGVIVVDTGESARASQPGYFPRWHPVFRRAVREWVEPEQEIGPQLERLGIEPGRCPPGRDDPSAHRPRRRPAPLPRHRDPRRARRDSTSHPGCGAGCAATPNNALAGLVQARPRSTSSRSRSGPSRRACA